MKKQLKECIGCLCVVTLVTLVSFVLIILLFVVVGAGVGLSLKVACATIRSAMNIADILSFVTLVVTVVTARYAVKSLRATEESMKASVIINANKDYFNSEMLHALCTLYDYVDQTMLPAYKWKYRDPGYGSPDGKNPANPTVGLVRNERVISGKWLSNEICPFIDEEKREDFIRELDEARRTVKGYFLNAYSLYCHELITKDTLLSICDKDGIKAFFMIVEPLEKVKNSAYNDVIFSGLYRLTKEIYAKYKKGMDSFRG